MPTLDWLDREHAFRIAQRVPTRVLRPHAAAPAARPHDNLLLQGDNLEALAALLPFYRGRVKCVFIDPPTTRAQPVADDNAAAAARVSARGATKASSASPSTSIRCWRA